MSPRFIISPDDSTVLLSNESFLQRALSPSPILYGNPEDPYIKIDPDFTNPLPNDEAAAIALKELPSWNSNVKLVCAKIALVIGVVLYI